MNLTIENPDNLDLSSFCDYLIRCMQIEAGGQDKFNAKLLDQLNIYINSIYPDYHLNIYNIIAEYFRHQIVDTIDSTYVITIDKNAKIENIPIERLAQLIAVGNLTIKGYNVFEEIYTIIANSIDSLYTIWSSENVG